MRLVHHDSADRTGPGRAHHLGESLAKEVRGAVASYANHYRQLGIAPEVVREVADGSRIAVEAWAPDLAEEMDALAAGAGVPARDVMALNARTEVLATLAPRDECSTVVREGRGDAAAVAFQTWDWSAALAPVGVVWRYRTDAGRWVQTFAEPGMLAKLGINDSGLALAFNILGHRSDTGRDGVPVHVVARRVLDEAASLADALELASEVAVSASSALTVVAADGAASLELAPAGLGVVRPTGGWLVHTNHFLDARLAPGGLPRPGSTSTARHDTLTYAVRGPVDTSTLATTSAGLCGPAGELSPVCMWPDETLPELERVQTLLTVRMVPERGEFECMPGMPLETARSPVHACAPR